jgi:sec-independent protein translocase protein TatC
MAKRADDDLFAETTMSFGEHLEELRVSLSKALIGLVVGFLIGMGVANWVVDYIQTPLREALENHYIERAKSELRDAYGKKAISQSVEDFIQEHRAVPEKTYLEASEFARLSALSDSARKPPASAKPAGVASAAKTKPPVTDKKETEPQTLLGGHVPTPQVPLMETRLWRPIRAVVKALSAQEAFMIWLKAAFVCGLVIASPFMFWQIWQFVAAGLYPHEKRYVHIYLPFSLILFLAGAATAFFIAFRYVLRFLFGFNAAMGIDVDPRISEWLSFVLLLPLGFGVAFQLPLVMLFLYRIGIFTIEAYLSKWRIAVLIIFVASMILTPTADPITMLLMAVPLTALYFLGIALCKWMPRNKSPFTEAYEP